MNPQTPSRSANYELFMLVLCVYALAALSVEHATGVQPEIKSVLGYADDAVCLLFFVDFIASLWRAEKRWHYFITWGWLDLLSSIPTLNVGRWGRLARIVRVFRVLRGLRAAKVLTTVVLRRRAENTFLAASLLAILLIIFCSSAILHFENDTESNIKTAEDAIWWSFTTITTVGYGDRFPITSEGRFVAVLLMCAGVGLFSTFSGLLAAWFLSSGQSSGDSELAGLRREVTMLRETIDRRLGLEERQEASAATQPDAAMLRGEA
jgi:voltage-gated potassium channel